MENIVGEIMHKQEQKVESLGPLGGRARQAHKQDGSLLNKIGLQ